MLGHGEGLCAPPVWLWDLAEVVWGVLGEERDATVCVCVCVCAAGGQQMAEPMVECARLLSVSCGYTGWGR